MWNFISTKDGMEMIQGFGYKNFSEFLSNCDFSELKAEFNRLGWWWPKEMTSYNFLSICSGLNLEFENNRLSLATEQSDFHNISSHQYVSHSDDEAIVELDSKQILEFITGFHANFPDSSVAIAHSGETFKISIGDRTVTFDSKLAVFNLEKT